MRVSVLVAHRVTEIYSSSSCAALYTARSTKVVRVNKDCVRVVCGSFERDDKNKRHRRVAKILSPLASTKKTFRVTFFEHFFF